VLGDEAVHGDVDGLAHADRDDKGRQRMNRPTRSECRAGIGYHRRRGIHAHGNRTRQNDESRLKMKRRAYQGTGDVALLQQFNSLALAETEGCGYLHPGDIPHHLFNGNKYYIPSDLLSIWEDEHGVAAWLLVGPRHRGFDAQVRPNLRGTAFAREVIEVAERRTIELMREHGVEGEEIEYEAYQCDEATQGLLEQMGWKRIVDTPWTVNRICLKDAPMATLPSGYRIRRVGGSEEAAAVANAHASAFPGANWTPELYRHVMESPGYAPEREFVVESSDGALAAFTVTWHDPLNKTGLFEPVGTHSEHRRRGLARALLCSAMQEMIRAGMEYAIVTNQHSNEAARSLYRSCGFTPWRLIDDYVKPIPARMSP
jgi:ribosomal protein S18 acetylase RimI-like enzyme